MFEKTGIPESEKILSVFPSEERLNRGPVAVIECFQEIPCNPCQSACKIGAITVGCDINAVPKLDETKCTGCALCISKCPGRAIMVLDGSVREGFTEMKIPYEFLPLPEMGQMVKALDRAGKYITDVEVLKVLNPPAFDRTPVVSLLVPDGLITVVRNIRTEA